MYHIGIYQTFSLNGHPVEGICFKTEKKSKLFFSFSSLYYRYRLSRKSNKTKPYFGWKIFVFSASEIHIVRLCTLYTRNMPLCLLIICPPNAQKLISPSNCPYNVEHFLTFLSANLCFYTQNSKKIGFPSNCAYNIGHFFDFFG